MIGIEWSHASFRAFRIGADGTVRDRKVSTRGILRVQDRRFAETLREEIGLWLAAGEERVVLAGTVGSREGWVQTRYLPCPAGVAELAEAAVPVPFGWAQVRLVPGLAATDATGVPEVMRGEETLLAGVLQDGEQRMMACVPGACSRWARIESGRIAGFSTWMTGEVRAVMQAPAALGRMMRDAPTDLQAFDEGLARSAEPGGMLHHLFGVRALGLAGRLSEGGAPAYLAGLLIGHEVREALPRGAEVHLIGAADLVGLYARAIAACRGRPVVAAPDTGALGLHRIGSLARWD